VDDGHQKDEKVHRHTKRETDPCWNGRDHDCGHENYHRDQQSVLMTPYLAAV
jgi:hypothetical protein